MRFSAQYRLLEYALKMSALSYNALGNQDCGEMAIFTIFTNLHYVLEKGRVQKKLHSQKTGGSEIQVLHFIPLVLFQDCNLSL